MATDNTLGQDIAAAYDQVEEEHKLDEEVDKAEREQREAGKKEDDEENEEENEEGEENEDEEEESDDDDDEEDDEDEEEEGKKPDDKGVDAQTDKGAQSEPPEITKWSPEDKKLFKEQPKAVQDWMIKRHKAMEGDYTRKTQELAGSDVATLTREITPLRQYAEINDMFAPHADVMRQKGLTPASIIKGWGEVERRLMEGDGIAVIQGLVNGYGIDRAELLKGLGVTVAEDGSATINPDVQKLIDDATKPFKEFMDNSTKKEQDAAKARLNQAAQEAIKMVEDFKAAQDDQGNLQHPHFDTVQQLMADIANGYKARGVKPPPLQEVYDMAVRAHPDASKAQRTQETETAKAEERKRAKEKAAKARAAGKSITGSPGAGQRPDRKANDPNTPLRDVIEAAIDEVESR